MLIICPQELSEENSEFLDAYGMDMFNGWFHHFYDELEKAGYLQIFYELEPSIKSKLDVSRSSTS